MTVLRIERIAGGGDGVAHLEDGMVVFIPRSAPGDTVEIEIVERKRRYARAAVRGVREPSADRVEPECPHYDRDRCGGCQLQHLSADAQRRAKAAIVEDALERIGGRSRMAVPVVPSAEQWRYRTRVALDAAGERIGYHRYDAAGDVFDLRDCRIARVALMSLWDALSRERGRLPPTATGLSLRQDRHGNLHVIVEGGDAPWNADALCDALRPIEVTVWWRPTRGAARAVAGDARGFPALAFEQVHPELAATIRDAAVQAVAEAAPGTAWDLYGGVGDTALALAEAGVSVWSVDADRSAVEWGRTHARHEGIQRVAGRAEHAIVRLPEPDAVVVNPPRGGLAPAVCRRLDAWGRARAGAGARLAYVSCDPATLGRDLKRLPAFDVTSLTAYDLFPQTAHVEVLAVLEAA